MPAIILYGSPAAGKGTVTKALTRLGNSYRLYQRLKVGPGRTAGYRMATLSREADISINTADMRPVDTAATIYGRVHARLGNKPGGTVEQPNVLSSRINRTVSICVVLSTSEPWQPLHPQDPRKKLPHYRDMPAPKNLTE